MSIQMKKELASHSSERFRSPFPDVFFSLIFKGLPLFFGNTEQVLMEAFQKCSCVYYFVCCGCIAPLSFAAAG
jgi:hypothetical protein